MNREDIKVDMVVYAGKDIFDHGDDCHVPGFLARRGDVLIVRSLNPNSKKFVASVSHPSIKDNSFSVEADEIFKDDPLVTIVEQREYCAKYKCTLEERFTK